MTSTIILYESKIQATPSTVQEIISETSVSSLKILTTTIQIRETVTPSAIQEIISETPVSSLEKFTTTIQIRETVTPSTIQEIISETPVSSLKLLTTTVQIRETVIVMPNVKEMDCKVSSIIGGFIGFVLGAVVVITICIITVCVFFTLRKKKIKQHDYNNK